MAVYFLPPAFYFLALAIVKPSPEKYFLLPEKYFLAPAVYFLALENYFLALEKAKLPVANMNLTKTKASSRRTGRRLCYLF